MIYIMLFEFDLYKFELKLLHYCLMHLLKQMGACMQIPLKIADW